MNDERADFGGNRYTLLQRDKAGLMDQQCPQCDKKFRLLNLSNCGNMSNYPTAGEAAFCPFCGVMISAWASWIGKVVFIIRNEEEQGEVEVVLKSIAKDGETFTVYSEWSGRSFEVKEKFVFTP